MNVPVGLLALGSANISSLATDRQRQTRSIWLAQPAWIVGYSLWLLA